MNGGGAEKISEDRKPWSVFNDMCTETQCEKTHVSLFSGCGGIDLGLRAAGFKTVFANDICEDAAETHRLNLGDITVGDIRTIDLPHIDSPDILTAGFPCQPFSNAGLRKGVNDSRGDLYLAALRAVETLKPKTVLFENVRGLLSSRHDGKRVIETIVENLYDLGYDVTFSLVDASKHNVPSRRLRVLIVGVRRIEKLGIFSFPPRVVRDGLALKDIVLNVPRKLENQSDVLQLSPQSSYLESLIPEGGSWKDISYDQLPERMKKIADNSKRYHSPKFYRRFHRDDIAGTITAAFTPEKAGIFHPIEHRPFSVREVARIQSFPDWFIFVGKGVKSKYQQIGNAVPPRLAYEIGLQIQKVLQGENLLASDDFIDYDDFVANSKVVRVTDAEVVCRKDR